MKKFKVLLIYPNIPGMLVVSVAIGIFTRLLKDAGFDVELFDATLHTMDKSISPLKRVEYAQARDFDYKKDLGIELHSDLIHSFISKINDFKPDVLVISLVEDAVFQCLSLLDSIRDKEIPHIVGGIFPTSAPELCLSYPQINTICLGEGEETLLKFCTLLRDGKDTSTVENTWVKDNGTILKNKIANTIDINKSVIPDYSLFNNERLYRPMGGKILKTIPLEMYRGCPYQCTFCCSPFWDRFYMDNNNHMFHRRKSIDRVIEEVDYLSKKHNPDLFYIIDDTFLARPINEIEDFVEKYKQYSIPFWMNTRPETITEYKMSLLKEINCYRISIGMECGDESFRRDILKRRISNNEFPERISILRKSGIPFSINNIIGFPGETRELIFKTIDLNRSITGYDSITVSIFTPYHGSVLRDVCIENGFIDSDTLTGHTTESSILNMPQLSSKQITGLMRTFCMYVKFPKHWWHYIKTAEEPTIDGNNMFTTLNNIYHEIFFSSDQFSNKDKNIPWSKYEETICDRHNPSKI